jgi:hypothetical protein
MPACQVDNRTHMSDIDHGCLLRNHLLTQAIGRMPAYIYAYHDPEEENSVVHPAGKDISRNEPA